MAAFRRISLACLPLIGLCLQCGGQALASLPEPAAAGGVPWHPDLASAKAAAVISRQPVLIVFIAGSSPANSQLDRSTFSSPATAALLTACFEPVRVDVEAQADVARTYGISQVPTACVIDAADRKLAEFSCGDSPESFIAAAGRAVHDAAAGSLAGTAGQPRRDRSDFASQTAAPQAPTATTAQPFEKPLETGVFSTSASQVPTAPQPHDLASHSEEPTLPSSPPGWPAEPAAATADSAAVARQTKRTVLEPAPTAGMSPWLTAGAGTAAATAATAATATPATASTTATSAATASTAKTAATTASAVPHTNTADPVAPPEKKSSTDAFFAAIKKPFTIFSKPAQKPTDPQNALKPGGSPQETLASTAQPAAADTLGPMPLGLEGYCPVSLIDKGSWVEGRAQWGVRHRGRTYLFAGVDQQKAFLADPDRYAPALSGDDPVLACDAGKQVAGQRRYGVTYQARTYLFSSPETRTAFAADPQRYTTRVRLAEQTVTAPDASTLRR